MGKMQKMTIDEIHNKVIELWENQDISKRVPLFYSDLKKNSLLFIGLNPSFSETGFKRILKDTDYENIVSDLEDYFSFDKFEKKKIKDFQKIGQISREKYQYFTKFKDLSEAIKCDWEHIDLLFMRQTNQKEVEKMLKINGQFIREQIDLTTGLIKTLTPKMIVVENAFVSRILKEKLELKWDDNIGTYRFDEKTPTFLSGMLTGGRALDLGSYDRLKWHLKFVNKKEA